MIRAPKGAAGLVLLTGLLLGCHAPRDHGEEPAAVAAHERPDAAAHAAEIDVWRAGRLERLISETGWLTVVGLHWLDEGENAFGASSEHPVPLPGDATPRDAGVFLVRDGRTSVIPAEGVPLMLGDAAVEGETELTPDDPGPPDVLRLGDVSFYVIARDGRLGIRVKDPNSAARREFTEIHHFPVSLDHRVPAVFEPYDEPRTVQVPTVLGGTTPMQAPGRVRFEIGGEEQTLEPMVSGPEDTSFFFIFRDATSPGESYPGGRFLYTERVAEGPVVLDFNRAYNPPCAFTAFATCPLPPRQNIMTVRIEAGEKNYGDH